MAAATPESKPAVSPKAVPVQPTAAAARMRGGPRPNPSPSPAKPARPRLGAGLQVKKEGGIGSRAGAGGGARPAADPVPRPETPQGAALTAAGEAAVGSRVAVWWPEDKVYYKVCAESLPWLCWGTVYHWRPHHTGMLPSAAMRSSSNSCSSREAQKPVASCSACRI